ncbi:MAG: histidine phosphatase family protein [Faecalibacterium sp.]
MKTLYLMRHGQTLFNLRRKIQGWCDAPLTELGQKQAKIAGKYFSDNKIVFDHAYSSTSERACDTLELATGGMLPYVRTKGLKEWNFGVFEGESEDLNPKLPYGDFFKAYGGEGEMELRQRVADTLAEIMGREDHHTVLAVSHGASCRQFMRYWEKNQKVDQKERLGNCCILKFEYENGEFSLVEIVNHDFDRLE